MIISEEDSSESETNWKELVDKNLFLVVHLTVYPEKVTYLNVKKFQNWKFLDNS